VANVKAPPSRWDPVLPPVFGRLWARIKRFPWYRFAAGVVAGAPGLALTFFMRLSGIGVFLPEVAVDFTVGRIPGNVESFFIRTMGEGAKLLALITSLTIFLLTPGFYALPYRWIEKRVRNRWIVFALYGLVPSAIVLFAVLPILGAGFLGSLSAAGTTGAVVSQVLSAFLSASIMDYFLVDVASRHPEGFSLSRRQFIVAVGILIAAAAVTVTGLTTLVTRPARLVFASVQEMVSKEITPNDEFYVVTKNLIDPEVDRASWRLGIDGLVATPASYSLSDLAQRTDSQEELATLECVSNEVGGNLISTARWTGIPLANLLAAAGVTPAADWVAFTCADGYTVGVPLAKATNPSTMVALQMNRDSLPSKHGGPARIIVPGLYGMFHAKWVTRVTLVQGAFFGFWQQKGWTNSEFAGTKERGAIRTTAIIATPAYNAVVSGPVTIGGVALAGDRGIKRVEVSTDGGASWAVATLKTPPLSNLTWVLWTFNWTPPGGGSYRIVARAFDNSVPPDDAQQSVPAPPFPDGAAGYDSIPLLVPG